MGLKILLHLFPLLGLAHALVLARTPTPCAKLPKPHIPGAKVISITGEEKHNLTVLQQPPTLPIDVEALNICEVNVTLTHPGAFDTVLVQAWLPLDTWNERFVALGGSGWLAGPGSAGLAIPASEGYVAAFTDAGLPGGNAVSPELWALGPDGKVSTELLENFASRSVHDLAVVGKALIKAFYGCPAKYSFWDGCSTGGRQGLVEAQKYPRDFDGILASAPAIYWPEYVMAELWPQVVMYEAGYYPSRCVLDNIVNAAISACDAEDGVEDGVVAEPAKCKFDLSTVIGTSVICDGGEHVEITEQAASIVRKMWEGPTTSDGKQLWHGMPIGASLADLSASQDVNGTAAGSPFFVPDTWARYFILEDPDFNAANINTEKFISLFRKSKKRFDSIIGSANPDLSGFKKAGGKLLVWHGLSDQLIYPQDSEQYYREVQHVTGYIEDTFRLFLAPGVDHCGAGFASIAPGAVPKNPFRDLVTWVESGKRPDALEAATTPNAKTQFTRKICAYPRMAVLHEGEDPTVAESYECAL
ncbi:related to feruloyl esterase B precursor [Cephalotrichum gorgonifer]|uniref:Carboxylic ester hydrolase n=1 Tax=Cephalotrichum gorgonifer TaxID=2041049 RepID=A0AAE8STD1_9PEZI|nr:related to feruloyl esterase B precursor [Cephalotrichum gorgonifer]